jgi:hypothetical protein
MGRFLAGAAACLLLVTGVFLLWQSHAEQSSSLPSAKLPPSPKPFLTTNRPEDLEAPEASSKSREERRFSRADKDKDGKIESEELLAPREKAFAKLDLNRNGSLSFQEWAASTIGKVRTADADHNGWLSPAEYSTTAPPPPKKAKCSC